MADQDAAETSRSCPTYARPVDRVLPLLTQDGELIEGDPWDMVARLHDIWRPNTPSQIREADTKLPRP